MSSQSGRKQDISERSAYKLVGGSVLFPPLFAAAPFFTFLGSLGFIGVGVAFYFLTVYVLPFAFAGFDLGYYYAKYRNSNRRLLIGIMGYLAGFLVGLQVILWLVLPGTGSSLIGALGLSILGLIVAFYLSGIGALQDAEPNSLACVWESEYENATTNEIDKIPHSWEIYNVCNDCTGEEALPLDKCHMD